MSFFRVDNVVMVDLSIRIFDNYDISINILMPVLVITLDNLPTVSDVTLFW